MKSPPRSPKTPSFSRRRGVVQSPVKSPALFPRRRAVPLAPPKCQAAWRPLEEPIVDKQHWSWLPQWIALHAERGEMKKCWEGHRLLKQSQDGRTFGGCVWCYQRPQAGTQILACRTCRWAVCANCARRPRLPSLDDDPLFHGRDAPCLLPATTIVPETNRGTVIVCPGGNYEFLVPNEGMPAADRLALHGIRAFVLRYRLLPAHTFADMLEDLACAVDHVRRTHGGPVAAMGFSAGGHLVASLALRAASAPGLPRPLDAQVLVYPCIDGIDWTKPEDCGFFDFDGCFPAAQSLLEGRQALLGGPGFAAPPSFLVASTADEASPPKEHTDPYARALRKKGVLYTYMRRDFGAHGFGVEGGWMDKCVPWLQARGFGCASSMGSSPPAEK